MTDNNKHTEIHHTYMKMKNTIEIHVLDET